MDMSVAEPRSKASAGCRDELLTYTSGMRNVPHVRYARPSSGGSAMPFGTVRLLSVNCYQQIPTWPKVLGRHCKCLAGLVGEVRWLFATSWARGTGGHDRGIDGDDGAPDHTRQGRYSDTSRPSQVAHLHGRHHRELVRVRFGQ